MNAGPFCVVCERLIMAGDLFKEICRGCFRLAKRRAVPPPARACVVAFPFMCPHERHSCEFSRTTPAAWGVLKVDHRGVWVFADGPYTRRRAVAEVRRIRAVIARAAMGRRTNGR